jgi:hypothetical protein
MPHYVTDPVSERPISVDGPAHVARRKGKPAPKPAAEEEKAKSFECPSPGCTRRFGSERGMQTHFGRSHRQEKADKSMQARDGSKNTGL